MLREAGLGGGANGPSHASNTMVEQDLARDAGRVCGGGGDCARRKVDV